MVGYCYCGDEVVDSDPEPQCVCVCVCVDDLEGKVKWLDNYQKVKQLKEALVWLPVWERDKRAYVPEVSLHPTAKCLIEAY